MNHNFNFDAAPDDDGWQDSYKEPEPFHKLLTVRGFLEMHFGARGRAVYAALEKTAAQAVDTVGDGGQPGIVFSDDGGEFVSFRPTSEFDE